MNKRGLGKGLGALIPQEENSNPGVIEIKLTDIIVNEDQPRKNFNDEALQSLAESIKEHGVVQPIIVTNDKRGFSIVAGERRWRAARLAGLKSIPAIIKDYSKLEVMEIALIENIQREDLNPVEEAFAYKALIDEYQLTQEDIAKRISKSRSAIANSLRLINLPDFIKKMITEEKLTAGHGRALLAIEGEDLQIEIANKIVDEQLNVRQIESLVKKLKDPIEMQKLEKKKNIEVTEIEDRLKSFLGTKVILTNKKQGGKIEIQYYSNDDLERILELMEK